MFLLRILNKALGNKGTENNRELGLGEFNFLNKAKLCGTLNKI